MASNPDVLLPVNQEERIQSLDVLRGIVLLGILLMNITGFGLWGAYEDPTVAGGADGANLYSWVAANMFFEGTMRALFSMLFGVGMFVLTDRLEKKGAGLETANIYFRRMLWLIFFGLVHSYLLLWFGEILYVYGLMGLLIFSFRKVKPKHLTAIALFLMVCGTVWEYADYRSNSQMVRNKDLALQYKKEGKPLTQELTAAENRWNEIQEHRSPEFISKQNENMHKGYFHLVAFLAPLNMKMDTTFSYRYDLWDVMSMMLLGIALFKWKVLTAERPLKFYLGMMLLGYLVGLTINYYEVKTVLNSHFSIPGMSQAKLTYYWGRLFTSLGHIGAIMIFCKIVSGGWLKSSLAATGKMALTNYLMHSVICMFVFTGVGLALYGKLQRFELYYVVAAIWVFQLVASPVWLRYFRFGPAEWLWRTLSYQKRQPFLKKKTVLIDTGNKAFSEKTTTPATEKETGIS